MMKDRRLSTLTRIKRGDCSLSSSFTAVLELRVK